MSSTTQDYTITTPAGFLYLLDGYISDGDRVFRQLQVEPSLPSDVKVIGDPSRISYQGSNTYRTFPKTGTIPVSPARQMILRYKKTAPEITNETQFTAGHLVMDDEWFWVYNAGVLWRAYQWADDARAGGVTSSAQGPVYTGQFAAFQEGIRAMRDREKLPLQEPADAVNPKEVRK